MKMATVGKSSVWPSFGRGGSCLSLQSYLCIFAPANVKRPSIQDVPYRFLTFSKTFAYVSKHVSNIIKETKAT